MTKLDDNVFAMAQDLYVRQMIASGLKADPPKLVQEVIRVSSEFYSGWDETQAQLKAFKVKLPEEKATDVESSKPAKTPAKTPVKQKRRKASKP